jgi:hypothetical protein
MVIVLEHGGLLIDMPGMRELGMLGVSEGNREAKPTVTAPLLDSTLEKTAFGAINRFKVGPR